jgi:Zn-dependent protease with chaperone function
MIQAICWVLIHSLWQGLLLAVAAGCVIFCTKRSTAAMRYRLLSGLFFLFLVVSGLTFVYELYLPVGSGAVESGGFYPVATNIILAQVDGLGRYCSEHSLPIVSVWFLFFSVKTVRMAAGWGYIQHLRRDGTVVAPAAWAERVRLLAGELEIRQTVKLVESGLVRVPMVLGQLRPMIFIPLGLINHLPAGEMEAVLLHELAHVRRNDYLVNFLQQIAECLFFFNPGLLWVSSFLREERENCCDDIAIARTRDRVGFVRALVRFKEHSLRGGALAFPAGKRQLLYRVLRISQQRNKTLSGGERFFLLGSCLVLALLLASLHRPVGRETGKLYVLNEGGNGDIAAKADTAMADKPAAVGVGSPELMGVLETREQVAKNLQWVEEQLNQLHHNAAKAKMGQRKVKRVAMPMANDREAGGKEVSEGVSQDRQQAERDLEQAARDRQQALKDQAQAQEQAQLDFEQAQRDREQAVRDRAQAQRDREQAVKDKHQAELDRLRADKDRMQAELDRQQTELNRQQAEKDQLLAKKKA